MTHNEPLTAIDDLRIFRTKSQVQRYKSKILNKTFTFTRQEVVEYLDIKTGEIISKATARRLGVVEYNYGIFVKERNEILDSFRKEVKDFAMFVLMFRNKRRGISPNIDQIVEYYSKYTGKRSSNIKSRLLPQIMHRVVASPTLLMPPFQIGDKGTPAYEHLKEDFIAENTFFTLMFRKAFKLESST